MTPEQTQVLRHTGKTRAEIVRLTGISDYHVRRIRRELVDIGLIEKRLNRDDKGRVRGNVYVLAQPDIWNTATPNAENLKKYQKVGLWMIGTLFVMGLIGGVGLVTLILRAAFQ